MAEASETHINLAIINENINSNHDVFECKSLTSLIINKPYIIKKMCVLNSRYGRCILTILLDSNLNNTFKTFLPERVLETLTDNIIATINASQGKYTLTYEGQSIPLATGRRPKSLIKFDTIKQ